MIIRVTKYDGSPYPVTYVYKRRWFGDKLLYKYTIKPTLFTIPGIEYGHMAAIPRKTEKEWKNRFKMLYSYKNK